jgi:hypothetical protein
MPHICRRKRPMLAALALVSATTLALAAPAGAGAQDSSYSGAQYQITISYNCNNHTGCLGFGFGEWGWYALMPGGTGNAQITQCFHAGGGPGSGAGHESGDPGWTPTDVPGGVTDPNGHYLAIDGFGDVPPVTVPATYGHYTINVHGGLIQGQLTVAP